MSRLSPARRGDILFGALTVLIVVLRFRILGETGAPPTIDAGNWLAFGDTLLGHGARSTSIVYPPVVPLLTTGAVQALGLVNGVALLAALSSVAPSLGVYWTLRRCQIGLGALIPGLLTLGVAAVGEAAAWGGFPQLIALGLMPPTLLAFDRMADTWSGKHAAGAGLWLMLGLATSHLVASATIAASLIVVTIRLLGSSQTRPDFGRLTRSLGLVLLPTVWLWPLYVTLTRQVFRDEGTFRHLTALTWGTVLDRIEFIFRDQTLVWWPIFLLVLATPVLFSRYRHLALWRIPTALLIATAGLSMWTREGRYLYVFTVIAGLSIGLWVGVAARRSNLDLENGPLRSSATPTTLALTGITALVAIQLSSGLSLFRTQRNFYGILDRDLVTAIERAGDIAGPAGTIGVPSLRDAPLGWWVEAITRTPVVYGAPLRWLVFEDEIERAEVANRLFAPPFPTPERLLEAHEAGVTVLLLPTEWTFYDPEAVGEIERSAPYVVLALSPSGTVILLDQTSDD